MRFERRTCATPGKRNVVAPSFHETVGPDWLTPDRYRFGASSLLNDVLMQIRWLKTGRYQSLDYFTID